MSIFTSPILEISLDNLLDNYKLLSDLSKNSIAAAVVKDNAYGLGAVEVVQKLYKEGNCRNFFVAHGKEGAKIRASAQDANIFVLQGIGKDSLKYFKEAFLTPVISSKEQLSFWKQNELKGIKPVINIETGLNRLGFREDDLKEINEQDFSFVMSHLACADEQEHFMNAQQLNKFKELKAEYFPNLPASLAASDGTFLGKDFQLDMVRLGAAMYGINTTPYHSNKMKPVVFLKAPVLQVAKLKKGEYVGYSASFKADKDMKIAIASIGYGDGLPRSLSNSGRILGRVSMDNLILDVSDIADIKTGDMYEVLSENYTVDDMGIDAGTIGYEIISRIGKGIRYIRNYK